MYKFNLRYIPYVSRFVAIRVMTFNFLHQDAPSKGTLNQIEVC